MGSSTMHAADGTVFSVECEAIDVTRRSKPDLNWRYTDPSGHEHAWGPDETLPTLVQVVDDEGDDEYPAISHLECLLCRATVQPGWMANTTREYIAGLKHYCINGRPVPEPEFMAAARAAFPGANL